MQTKQNIVGGDSRIVYGANCTWWGSIDQVGTNGALPCCPHCKGVLFEMDSIEEWFKAVDNHEHLAEPGYRKFVEWQRGKCFPNLSDARTAYLKHLEKIG